MNVVVNDFSGPTLTPGPTQSAFADIAWIRTMLEFEAALALAEAASGVIDPACAAIIARCCNDGSVDPAVLIQPERSVASLGQAVIRRLTEVVGRQNVEAASFVHWGLVTQDLVDTALVLRLRAALDLIDTELNQLITLLAQRADLHRHTPQVGRVGLQHALPITFGLKIAGWLDGLMRHQQRLQELRARLLVVQLGGTAGTMASLGEHAVPVAEALAKALGLGVPDIAWQSQRDRFTELASVLGMLTSSLGKMALDMRLLLQTEIAELGELHPSALDAPSPDASCQIGAGCALTIAAAQRAPALVAGMFAAMLQEHERGHLLAQPEWEMLPQIAQLCGTALEQMRLAAATMVVDAVRMRTNLDLTGGQAMAEAVTLALSRKIGLAPARLLVEHACIAATRAGQRLHQVLSKDPVIATQLSTTDLQRLLDPATYCNDAARFVSRVLDTQRKLQGEVAMPAVEPVLPRVENGSVHLHYQIEGPASAPVLILSNSIGTSLELWAPQMPALLDHFRVLRYDARGHGQSDVPDGPYSIDEMGSDVISLMDQLGISRAHFCGISMGGMVGIWLAAHHPSRIERLVLCNTAPLLGPVEQWNNRIEQVQQGGMQAIVQSVIARWFTKDFQEHAVRQVNIVRDMLLQTPDRGYIASCAAIRDMDQRDSLATIRTPTLVIGGKYDKSTSPAQSRQMAERIADAKYVELHASHLSNWEMAQGFTRQVLGFLLAR